jgi:hypothetical protein
MAQYVADCGETTQRVTKKGKRTMDSDTKELKEIGLGFLLLVFICMVLYWLGHSWGNPNCETQGDGTVDCR